MNNSTFNQEAFISVRDLPGNVGAAFSNDVLNSGVYMDSLPITAYTVGDTSGRSDKKLPDVPESGLPKRISRKFTPLRRNQGTDSSVASSNLKNDFDWKTNLNNLNSSFPSEVEKSMRGFLKPGHEDESGTESSGNDSIFKKNSPKKEKIDSETLDFESEIKLDSSVFVNKAFTESKQSKLQIEKENDTRTDNMQSELEIYEQVRTILGENKNDWKNVIKAAKSNIQSSNTNNLQSESKPRTHSNDFEKAIEEIYQREARGRVELENILTHKFKGELFEMQQSMNKKINQISEIFNSFMMK